MERPASAGTPVAFEAVLEKPCAIDSHLQPSGPPQEFIAAEKARHTGKSAAVALLMEVENHLQQKLYYQFTEAAEKYLLDPAFEECWQNDATEFWRPRFLMAVVRPLIKKLNEMKVLLLLRRVADWHKGLPALKLLQPWQEALQQNEEAALLFKASQAFHLLHGGFIAECDEFLFEYLQGQIERSFGLSGFAEAEFHRASAMYAWHVKNYEAFYRHAMFYLQATDLDTMLLEDRIELAKQLCRAVILSDKIYSFTELLQHPIVDCISPGGPGHPQHSLVRDLVVICNAGDHLMFEVFVKDKMPQLEAAGLAPFVKQLKDKIAVFALLELAFAKPSKVLAFQEIASTCRVPINQVESLVMKVMAHGLMKGHIDGVDMTVGVSSQQPRLLDGPKIRALSEHFRSWAKTVQSVITSVESMSADLLQTQGIVL